MSHHTTNQDDDQRSKLSLAHYHYAIKNPGQKPLRWSVGHYTFSSMLMRWLVEDKGVNAFICEDNRVCIRMSSVSI